MLTREKGRGRDTRPISGPRDRGLNVRHAAHYRPPAFAPRQAEEGSILDNVMASYESCTYARPAMAKVGSRIEESGMLFCDRGRLVFRREQGGRWNLEGWPKSEVTLGQLGRLTGYVIDETTVAIERFIFET